MDDNSGQDLHAELLALMENDTPNEIECRKYLSYAKELFVKVTPIKFLAETDEYRGHSGDSDYIIACTACNEAAIQSNQVYIWEVKAPQCYVFEEDIKNRVKPSKDFISAENQLLHYYEESKNSDQFRSEFEITHPENVYLGGIIIGSKKTLVKSKTYSKDRAYLLYRRALELRQRYLYGFSGIKVMIWDAILNHLIEKKPVSTVIVNPASSVIKVADKVSDVVIGWKIEN